MRGLVQARVSLFDTEYLSQDVITQEWFDRMLEIGPWIFLQQMHNIQRGIEMGFADRDLKAAAARNIQWYVYKDLLG